VPRLTPSPGPCTRRSRRTAWARWPSAEMAPSSPRATTSAAPSCGTSSLQAWAVRGAETCC